MHERSLVQTLLEQVRGICRDRNLSGINGIRIGVGDFSGVEANLLQNAYDEISADFFETPVQLEIDRIPLKGTCRDCRETFEIRDYTFICPDCQGTSVQIVSGNELQLISLTLDDESPFDNAPSDLPEDSLMPSNRMSR